MLLGGLALTCSIAFQASATEKFKVITTFTIIADMAKNVAGDAAEVSSITKPGAEIHEYQPTPGDIKRAQGAQLILANGMNLELWFQRFYQHLNGVPEVIVSSGVTPVGITEGPYEGKPNPHAWMSPDNALIYVDNIRDALIKYDPANAQTYQRNADTYKAKITQTLAPLRKQIAELPENQRWMVTSEGAFSYLARDLGLPGKTSVNSSSISVGMKPVRETSKSALIRSDSSIRNRSSSQPAFIGRRLSARRYAFFCSSVRPDRTMTGTESILSISAAITRP